MNARRALAGSLIARCQLNPQKRWALANNDDIHPREKQTDQMNIYTHTHLRCSKSIKILHFSLKKKEEAATDDEEEDMSFSK